MLALSHPSSLAVQRGVYCLFVLHDTLSVADLLWFCAGRVVCLAFILSLLRHHADSLDEVAADEMICTLATGHSSGGALATLAAFDIRKQLLDNKQSNTQVVCYTFAAPRTGNHAFARENNAAVPDTWSVINDQVWLCSIALPLVLQKQLLGLLYSFAVKTNCPLECCAP